MKRGEVGIVAQVVHRDDGGRKDVHARHRHLPRLLRFCHRAVVHPFVLHVPHLQQHNYPSEK